MNRSEKIDEAIKNNKLPILNGRVVGTPGELSRISGASPSTVRYAYCVGGVPKQVTQGSILYVDAEGLSDYFRSAKPGRKKIKEIS